MMTTTSSTPADLAGHASGGPGQNPVLVPIARKRRVMNVVATVLMIVSIVAAAVPLFLVTRSVVARGSGVLTSGDWWTGPIPADVAHRDLVADPTMCSLGFGSPELCSTGGPVPSSGLGMQPAIVGTLVTIIGASLIAVPLGVATGVYLNEYGRGSRFSRVVRFLVEVMIGVPSVIAGVLVFSVWVVRFGTSGRSGFAASLALAVLMLPIIVRSTEQMLSLVPEQLREASAALGARRWRTTLGTVLPAAAGGIVSGCLLAIARAAGETAPVMFTIGFVTTTNWSPFGQNTTLSAQIYSQIQNGGVTATSLAWGAALTLVLVVIGLTGAARLVQRRFGSVR